MGCLPVPLRSKFLRRSSVYSGQSKTTYVSYIVMGGEFKKTSMKPITITIITIRKLREVTNQTDTNFHLSKQAELQITHLSKMHFVFSHMKCQVYNGSPVLFNLIRLTHIKLRRTFWAVHSKSYESSRNSVTKLKPVFTWANKLCCLLLTFRKCMIELTARKYMSR